MWWHTVTQGRGKWRGNWRMEWVASTLHTTSERGVSSITTADGHTSAVSSRLKWRPRRFKWTRPFRRKTKYGFCAGAMTFQTQSTTGFPGWWSSRGRVAGRSPACSVTFTVPGFLGSTRKQTYVYSCLMWFWPCIFFNMWK